VEVENYGPRWNAETEGERRNAFHHPLCLSGIRYRESRPRLSKVLPIIRKRTSLFFTRETQGGGEISTFHLSTFSTSEGAS